MKVSQIMFTNIFHLGMIIYNSMQNTKHDFSEANERRGNQTIYFIGQHKHLRIHTVLCTQENNDRVLLRSSRASL